MTSNFVRSHDAHRPERGDRFFISADGELDPIEFANAVSGARATLGRTFDPARWFCERDELIHFEGRTYAVSNQWGLGTDATFRALVSRFPQAGVTVEPSAL